MALSLVTVGQIITAYLHNLLVQNANQQAYTQVIPTGVSGTGVSVNSYGKISLSSATTPTIAGCFTTDYQTYIIEIEGETSTNATWILQFRSGGSTISTANYDSTELLGRNSGATSTTAAAATSWSILPSGTRHKIRIELAYPGVAADTTGFMHGAFHEIAAVASVNNGFVSKTLTHRLATAYDGFIMTCSQSFTGTMRIIGVNNN